MCCILLYVFVVCWQPHVVPESYLRRPTVEGRHQPTTLTDTPHIDNTSVTTPTDVTLLIYTAADVMLYLLVLGPFFIFYALYM